MIKLNPLIIYTSDRRIELTILRKNDVMDFFHFFFFGYGHENPRLFRLVLIYLSSCQIKECYEIKFKQILPTMSPILQLSLLSICTT